MKPQAVPSTQAVTVSLHDLVSGRGELHASFLWSSLFLLPVNFFSSSFFFFFNINIGVLRQRIHARLCANPVVGSVPFETLTDAFGLSSLGIIVVKDLPPEYIDLRAQVLSNASYLAALPKEELGRVVSTFL
jgi:hypothetical protein